MSFRNNHLREAARAWHRLSTAMNTPRQEAEEARTQGAPLAAMVYAQVQDQGERRCGQDTSLGKGNACTRGLLACPQR